MWRFRLLTSVIVATLVLSSAQADAQSTMTEIARLGRGSGSIIGWHPDQAWLYVASPTGIWVYDGDYNVIDRLDSLPESLEYLWETKNSDPVPENVPDISYEVPVMSLNEIQDMQTERPVSWSPDGSRFIGISTRYVASEFTYSIFETATVTPIVELEGRIAGGSQFWWHGDKVVSNMGVYDTSTGKLLSGFPSTYTFLWLPDGNLITISQQLGYLTTVMTKTDIHREGTGWRVEYGDKFYGIAARSDDPMRITFITEHGFLNEIDARTGNFTQSHSLHNRFSELAWSPDSQQIASIVYGSGNYRIAVWNTDLPIAYEPSLIFGGEPYEEGTRNVFPLWGDGRLAWLEPDVITAYGSNYPLNSTYYGIEQWNLNDPTERRLRFMDWGHDLTYQPNADFSQIAGVHAYGVTFIDLEKSRQVMLYGQGMDIDCVCGWSREGDWFAYYGKLEGEAEEAPMQIHVWEIETRTLVTSIPRLLWNFQTAPIGTLAAGVTDEWQPYNLLYVLDLATGEVVTSIGGDDGAIIDQLEWNPGGDVLAFSLYGDDITPTLILFDPRTNQVLDRTALASRAYRLAWSPDGTKIAASLWDGTIQVFEV